MLIDARSISSGQALEADVCIAGAGAAGITLAREFIGQPFRVALIESGGFDLEADTQALYQGETAGHPYFPLDICRLRYFGGTTNHWAGTCRPLDESDFEPRDWVPYSGWPFLRAHLDPFYQRAQPICQLGPYTYDVNAWTNSEHVPFRLTSTHLITDVFQYSPPTRFGEVYRDELIKAGNITIYLHANVVDIETPENAAEVTRLQVATLEGNRFSLSGRFFVLALGGIETPRLLLSSNKIQKTGLGNQHDRVGRFFMDHPILRAGTIALSDSEASFATSLPLYQGYTIKGSVIKGFLSPSIETQRERGLLNFGARPEYVPQRHVSEGMMSWDVLRQAVHERQIPEGLFEHIINIIGDLDDIIAQRFRKKSQRMLALRYWQEPAPNPDNRVTLIEERDALGLPKIHLSWPLTELDQRTMYEALTLIGQELGSAGIGRLRLNDAVDELWSDWMAGSYHHMGTTRMSKDPKQGVVDEHLRVHNVANLFIASSAVFPTAGQANPTLTIVALTIRLADHLKELMT